jgi:cytochrome c-type biogenesis protein CcmH
MMVARNRVDAVAAPVIRAQLSSILVALLVLAPAIAFADAPAPGEHELEGRLFAPCCWTQTLDIHESGIAETLRREIRERLRAGERSADVEADLVSRYGAQILAVPTGRDPREQIVWLTLGGMGLVLVGLFLAARRWARGSTDSVAHAAVSETVVEPDAIDARIEAELEKLGV